MLIPLNGAARLKIREDEYVEIPQNRVLLFTGNFFHAGCAYEELNYRVHAYVTWSGNGIPRQKVRIYVPPKE